MEYKRLTIEAFNGLIRSMSIPIGVSAMAIAIALWVWDILKWKFSFPFKYGFPYSPRMISISLLSIFKNSLAIRLTIISAYKLNRLSMPGRIRIICFLFSTETHGNSCSNNRGSSLFSNSQYTILFIKIRHACQNLIYRHTHAINNIALKIQAAYLTVAALRR